ncbi:efflux pump [Salmonella enterica subsp. enterica]|uniref:Efflux pump n=1 Tax=Salmonella enterica I TaxID=59201 RepID=A0A379WQ40_SALET|nr:efflux pump [Salmonella enterica subsp. enterica]
MKKVYVQAAAKYRMLPDDINLWYVRNKDGGMVPLLRLRHLALGNRIAASGTL